ncbi:hypothetical protein MVEN_00044400 [Mycena venus]|uniref:Uncharacterized protein n=1 Tax=Mycena venus TaxID=2733690 RepID=A0A8H6Z6X4_9AGAR|nr:hypothetical protein MVEN_00044400 [Mycena venus]
MSTYDKIHGLLAELRRDHISPIDILIQILDRYPGNLYPDDSTKLMELLEIILMDLNVIGNYWTMETESILPGVAVVTPDFIENWIECTPFLTSILTAASQTERAKKHNKLKKPDKMVQVVTRQLLYQSSDRCLAFQAEFGLFLWSTGCARQTIDALFRCGLSVGCDSVLSLVQLLGDGCTTEAAEFAATQPHGLGYDNMNISTSIFVEQRGANGPTKATSGTFGVLYGLRNAKLEHMLIEPIM